MKKLILFAAILFAGVTLQAQDNLNKETKLTVNLSAFHTIEVNGSDVVLNYVTMDNYINGVAETMPSHLKVFSVGNYNVKVSSKTEKLMSGTTEGMNASDITVGVADTEADGGIKNPQILSMDGAVLFSGKNSSIEGNTFDIVYKGAGQRKFSPFFDDENEENAITSYSVLVTYSIETL